MAKYVIQDKKPENREACAKYYNCSAQLCPAMLNVKAVWFSDEEICTNQYFQKLKTVVNQKKLRKIKAKGLFTVKDLASLNRVGKKTKGLIIK